MKKSLLLLFALFALFVQSSLVAQSAFINEINYLASDPTGQGLEIAGESGQNLQGWSVVVYELGGAVAATEELENMLIPSQQNGYGTVWYEMEQLSGGNGVALINPTGTVEHFVSFGLNLLGLTATEGPAQGMTAQNAGIQLLPFQSLQMTGNGTGLLDFVWSLPLSFTPGDVNTSQSFGGLLGRVLGGLFGYQATGSDGTFSTQTTVNQINITAFPNPAIDYLRLQRSADQVQDGTLPVQLLDASGRLILRNQLAQGQDYLELNLSDLSAGIYLLRVGEGPAASVQKIVKK